MSLKAKIEAVVYAAEEPVTLAQLAGLFAEEAMEWKQLRAAEEAALQEASEPAPVDEPLLAVEEASDAVLQSDASLAPPAPVAPMTVSENSAEDVSENSSESESGVEATETPETEVQAKEEAEQPASETEISAEPASPVEEDPAKLAEEEKRAARQREREVRDILRIVLDELIADYATSDRGIEIREIAGGYRLATKPEYHDAVRSFVKSLKPPMKLSLPALETLAVIAYKQPITAPEVGEIRGVDSAGVLGSLISRKLVTTAGRKQVVGRPILYKTTKEFLVRFGLKDLNELPSMEEFEKMATGALAEMDEAVPEATPDSSQLDQVAAIEQPVLEESAEPKAEETTEGHATETEPAGEEIVQEEAVVEETTEEAVVVAVEEEASVEESPEVGESLSSDDSDVEAVSEEVTSESEQEAEAQMPAEIAETEPIAEEEPAEEAHQVSDQEHTS
jgi:segregation and condensation protein B